MSAEQARLHELLLQKQEMLSVDLLRNYDPYPYQLDFHNDVDPRKALQSANKIGKCISYSTLIDTVDGKKRIGDIFGSECSVLTYPDNKPRKVLNWVRKPKEECFRITLADGQWVEVAGSHRILCPSGYLGVDAILQSLPESGFCQHPSSSVRDQLIRVLGVRHLTGKVRDCLRDCLVGFRLRDARPLVDEDSVEVYPPSQVDALRRSDYLSRLDGLAHKDSGSLYDKLCRFSTLCAETLISVLYACLVGRVFSYVGLCKISCNQSAQRFSNAEYHRTPFGEARSQEYYISCQPLDTNKIVSVKSVGCKTLYDMEVEDVHNYVAGGMVHHNTWAVCAEDAIDLTGRYPDWWEGFRFEKPVRLVCGGVNNDKTRDLLQKALFGNPITHLESLGTGWIPKSCIGKIQKKRGVPDAFGHVMIKHHKDGQAIKGLVRGDRYKKQDGWSIITFQSYEAGKEAWMGDEIDIFHLDEEPPEDIFDQAGRGCISSGGRIRLSYTPENGKTNVVMRVEADWSMHKAGWKDVAGGDFVIETPKKILDFKEIRTLKGKPGHMDEEKTLLAAKSFPAYQLPMRSEGEPVLGRGLVFPYSEEMVKINPFPIPEHWTYGAAMDFGGSASTSHATTWGAFAYDEDTDTVYLIDCMKLNEKEISGVSADVTSRPYSWIPIQWPHDGNKELGESGSTKEQYVNHGLNMFYNEENPQKSHFTNPPEKDMKEGTGGIQIMPGITEISNRISDGRFKVFSTLNEWFEEYREYHHKKDGKIADVNDDLMAMTRYGVQSTRHFIKSGVKKHKKLNMLPTGSWLS